MSGKGKRFEGERSAEPANALRSCLSPFRIFLAIFAASRVGLHIAGLRFSAEHVPAMMHFVDTELLGERLLESTLHLHGQPPLMTLVMGVILKVAGLRYGYLMQGLMLIVGILIGRTIITVLLRAGCSGVTATFAAVIFTLLPQSIVYENYWFFSYPLLLLMLLLCEKFLAARKSSTFGSWSGFFLIASALVLIKSVFHITWLWLVVGAALLSVTRERRRVILVAAVFPFLLAGSWYVKNAVMFGRFEASSWVGFGLARKTWHQLPRKERARLVREGELDPIAEVPLYGDVDQFAAVLGMPEPTGVPILDNREKSSGWTNFHHQIYLEATIRMRNVALDVIRKNPGAYVANVLETIELLFSPATGWRPVKTPYESVRGYCDAIDGILHSPLPLNLNPWSLLALMTLTFTLPSLRRWLASPGNLPDDEWLSIFIAFLVLWVWTLAVLLDTGETARIRVMTDGVLWVGAIVSGRRFIRLFRRGE